MSLDYATLRVATLGMTTGGLIVRARRPFARRRGVIEIERAPDYRCTRSAAGAFFVIPSVAPQARS
ncbi:MAG TPA: hypothetical protein VMD07_10890 [Candidatus Acidoferrales bacterium]|nr:hypothetical protein [Candidatus Acidoferrales bacterium]